MPIDIVPPPKSRDEQEESPPAIVVTTQKQSRWGLRFLGLLFLTSLVTGSFLFVRVGKTFNIISEEVNSFLGIEPSALPLSNPAEKNRLDILLLGLRGEGDPHGGSLTDTMMLLSIDTKANKAALISIPRDIYLSIPLVDTTGKINEAFSLGEERQRGGGGLFLSKIAAQEVLGINIDYAVAVDFEAFKDSIDLLGGVDVDVANSLRETRQWGGIDFYVPAGRQHMDGDQALLYVRSRFSTSDFDRARRQQEVILAIQNKALSLGFLANPTKISGILTIIGKHIRTDISSNHVPEVLNALRKVSSEEPRRLVLDTQSGLLYSTVSAIGSYILLPSDGSFGAIHKKAQNIFLDEKSDSRTTKQKVSVTSPRL